MVRKMGFKNVSLNERAVRVPLDLTSDPLNRQGQFGRIESADPAKNQVTVLFEDGQSGLYQFDALEILYSSKQLEVRLSERRYDLAPAEIELVQSIIDHAASGMLASALGMAYSSEKVKSCCVTNLKSFYEMAEAIKPYKTRRRGLGL